MNRTPPLRFLRVPKELEADWLAAKKWLYEKYNANAEQRNENTDYAYARFRWHRQHDRK